MLDVYVRVCCMCASVCVLCVCACACARARSTCAHVMFVIYAIKLYISYKIWSVIKNYSQVT